MGPFSILPEYQDAEIPFILFLTFEELDQSGKKWVFLFSGLADGSHYQLGSECLSHGNLFSIS